MTATQHGIIRFETVSQDHFGTATIRARCACGKWRQAGSFPEYPGPAGATLVAAERVDCGDGDLEAKRVASPFPADPESMERAAGLLDRKSAELRAEAARLIKSAEEYEAGNARIRKDLARLTGNR